MSRYEVLTRLSNGRDDPIPAGTTVELTDANAAPLLACKAIRKLPDDAAPTEPKPATLSDLTNAELEALATDRKIELGDATKEAAMIAIIEPALTKAEADIAAIVAAIVTARG